MDSASEIIEVWEKKQEDLLFNLLLGLKGPFQKGKVIFKIVSDKVRFAVLEELEAPNFPAGHFMLDNSAYKVIYNEEIYTDELSINIPIHRKIIFRLRRFGYFPIEIKTENYPINADTLVIQRIDTYE